MARGKVKFYNAAKGFGFITSHDTGEEIFVHVTGLKEDISENDEVEYDVTQGRKGPNAVNVRQA
ncbi:cold-shock protein [Emticicia aquatilis]|uniref:Cold-shock protein n=1 Tax=Emticicia aquatilis TaxID=1537369 RepID=A0A916Z9A5_9BACT|nr:cold shock domain-containing protein [Emticicia aquatilis]GGD80850.1 cold-shock protein [Emticicia aquatilis]